MLQSSEFLGALPKRRLFPLRPVWSEPGRRVGEVEEHYAVGSWWVPGVAVRGSLDGLYAVGTESGAPAWTWQVPGMGVLAAMSEQVVDGVGLAVHGHEQNDTLHGIAVTAFEVETGEQLWSHRPGFDSQPYYGWGTEPLAGMVAVAPGRALVLTDRRLVAFSLRSGQEVWSSEVGSKGGDGVLAVAGDEVIQVVTAERRAAVRRLGLAEGTVRTEAPLPVEGAVGEVRVVHQDPVVLWVEGHGRRRAGAGLLVLGDGGEVTARIPLNGAHGTLHLDVIGIDPDRPVLACGDLVVVPTLPVGGGRTQLTAFDRNGGGVRWSWKSRARITGLAREGGHLLVLDKWVAEEEGQSDGAVHLNVLDAGTGRAAAGRRLSGYQIGMAGRLRLDGDRLVRISRYGDGIWNPTQMYRLS